MYYHGTVILDFTSLKKGHNVDSVFPVSGSCVFLCVFFILYASNNT